jgi:hypothetical protein
MSHPQSDMREENRDINAALECSVPSRPTDSSAVAEINRDELTSPENSEKSGKVQTINTTRLDKEMNHGYCY